MKMLNYLLYVVRELGFLAVFIGWILVAFVLLMALNAGVDHLLGRTVL